MVGLPEGLLVLPADEPLDVEPEAGRTPGNRSVWYGMRNSAVQPSESRVTETSQMPFQFSFTLSIPTSCASHIAPFGFVRNRNAPRRSWKLSIRSVM
jgi:hypothetical protein